MKKKELLQGNEAAVRGALNAGCNFFAGYPITPSSEIVHGMARLLPKFGGVFVQMEDEIASISAAIGASMVGAIAMTATSGPGFSLMQESIGYAAMTESPLVIINVMRAGPSTGIPTAPSQGDVMQARYGSHGDYPIIVLAPASVGDMYRLTIDAFKLAFEYSSPVVVLSDEVVGHMRESVSLPPLGEKVECKGKVKNLFERKHRTGLAHLENGLPTTDLGEYRRLIERLFSKFDDLKPGVKFEGQKDAEVVLISYGSSYRLSKSAAKLLLRNGISTGVLKLETLFPFPEGEVRKFSKSAELVIVPEMNRGQLVKEVERVCCCRVKGVSYYGSLILPEELAKIVEVLL
ncbi:transketolase C-terminal domain-containing protein [Archaeoglobus neptunius]|uniref:transketolase C-terminal domain-containing protein n=1 Tax=Archaeoglobus neptunius TaxID=2798580 RepID=UPI001928A0E4|nr:transketolase C-terminal domain-containing protein [Archaeoglobus neptunius]